MNVFLVSHEFIAAGAPEEAVEFFRNDRDLSDGCDDLDTLGAKVADFADFYDDPYNDSEPSRSMIGEATRRLAGGEALPFHVATSMECI